jgi:uncharacterized SAM-binding protein YcdF (DUF218 family)
VKQADAIVVLGCRVESNGELSHAASRRARGALRLYEVGEAPRIVPSGGKRWGDSVEALAFGAQLTAWGVPSEALYPELSSLTTTENAAYSVALVARVVGRRPRLTVVTCTWHLARALESFRRFDADVDGFGVDPPNPNGVAGWIRRAREAASRRLDKLAYARAGADFERYALEHLGKSDRGARS